MSHPSPYTRRRFVGLLSLLGLGGPTAARDATGDRIVPSRTIVGPSASRPTPREGPASPPQPAPPAPHAAPPSSPSDEVVAALARPAGEPRGLDPARALTRFDWGSESRLPSGQTLRTFQLVAREVEVEVAPGLLFPAWTYNGSVPGPTLRCRAGDRVRVHFRNESLADHTIHFHGAHPAAMDGVSPYVRPGQEYTYEFDAAPAGLHLYHCHVPPVDLHMSRGMFGTFLIDPEADLPHARELVIALHAWDVDFDKKNEVYAINGCANYFRDHPIEIRTGELIRVYLVSFLEYDPLTSFHLHGQFFRRRHAGQPIDLSHAEDVLSLCQSERSILEFSYEQEGTFMFHPHQNAMAERGAMGHFRVTSKADAPGRAKGVARAADGALSEPLRALLENPNLELVASQQHPLLGHPAVDFVRTDTFGRPFRLADLATKKPVVVIFYNGYYCNHCAAQLFELHRRIDLFRELGAEVVALSADTASETAEKFQKYGAFAFPVLSDPGQAIAEAYGVYDRKNDALQHGLFIIDQDGKVCWAYRDLQPFTHLETILYELARDRGVVVQRPTVPGVANAH